MKKRRIIYIVIGVALIIINLLTDIVSLINNKWGQEDDAYNIGYFIGSHIFLITGIILLRQAYKLQIKIEAKENNELEESIKGIGKTNS